MITPTPLRLRPEATGVFRPCHRGAICIALALLLAASATARAQSDATNAAPAAEPDHPTEPPVPESSGSSLSLHPEPSTSEALESNSSPAASSYLSRGDPEELPQHLLVVYNTNDPDSQALAQYYASRRNIPDERVLGIACPTQEEITRAQYDQTVREPIISYIFRKNWMTRRSVPVQIRDRTLQLLVATQNDVWAMVLMRGIPLKIGNDPTNPESLQHEPALQTNAAAVDNELALLPVFGLPLGGFIPNSFYDGAANGLVRAGPALANRLILVTRLDGPQPSDVRRMIDDSLYAEQHRLAGFAVVDSRGLTDVKNPYTLGDIWMRHARDMLLHDGWAVDFDDDPNVIPPTDPLNRVAIYLGWYRDGAYGPWVTPPDRFVRGAIAYHLHSSSAWTVRSATAGWVGPLIAHGAAATMGCVYEPYLNLTPHVDIFAQRMLAGDYFAEAAYACQLGLSWMVTVVGDPLYRPFEVPLPTALAEAGGPESPQYDWLLLQDFQRKLNAGQIADTPENLERYLNIRGAVAQEELGDHLLRLEDPRGVPWAEVAYQRADTLYRDPIDRVRIGLKLAQLYSNHAQGDRAQAELKSLRETYPADAARYGVADPLVPTGAPPSASLPPAPTPTPTSAEQSAQLPRPPGPPKPP
jgi:uncharacterized protein (TIGR03790 family)